MKSHCLHLSVLFLALTSSALANTWYVNGVSGKDNNNCITATTACKTIGHAIGMAHAKDVIYVAAATYSENLTIPFSLDIIGASARTTIIDGGGVATTVYIPYQPKGPVSQVTLANLTIQNGFSFGNETASAGGGVYNDGSLMIIYCTITGNSASSGGGVFTGANPGDTLDIDRSTITGNDAGVGGGVLLSSPQSYIYNTTISNNTATIAGGGVLVNTTVSPRPVPVMIINDTITGNAAPEGAGIGYLTANMSIDNSTISGNRGTDAGAGIWAPGAEFPMTIQNSIVSNNTVQGQAANCATQGSLVSDGYNISSDSSCNFSSAGDMNNTDPLLGSLLNNGGATYTMAVKPGSPAIDAGNPAGCTDGKGHLLLSDQRGDHRPGDPKLTTGCDIGAYEYQFPK